VLFEGAFANLHPLRRFKEDRAPLLFIAFGEDHICPPEAIGHMCAKYNSAETVVEFEEFEGRPHFPGVPGWEEVADYALSWATEKARAGAPTTTVA
jgi:hypothetical protein